MLRPQEAVKGTSFCDMRAERASGATVLSKTWKSMFSEELWKELEVGSEREGEGVDGTVHFPPAHTLREGWDSRGLSVERRDH